MKISMMFHRSNPPEALPDYAQRAEAAGFDEVWVVEDLPFGGGISQAAIALAVTQKIQVGLGILPAVVRNPAYLAMEIATLARTYPGRFLPGIGHGVAHWIKQVGAFPSSQLAALEETTAAVRALLDGNTVIADGQHVHLDTVALEYPPDNAPPISLGVRGPKSLAVAGRVADGTILAEVSAPTYVKWARERIAESQRAAGRSEHHTMTVFTHCSVGPDPVAARDALRPMLAERFQLKRVGPQLEPSGIVPQLKALHERVGSDNLADNLPEEWLDQFAVCGSPEQCAASIRMLADAGADSVVLVPIAEPLAMMARLSETVLPLLRG